MKAMSHQGHQGHQLRIAQKMPSYQEYLDGRKQAATTRLKAKRLIDSVPDIYTATRLIRLMRSEFPGIAGTWNETLRRVAILKRLAAAECAVAYKVTVDADGKVGFHGVHEFAGSPMLLYYFGNLGQVRPNVSERLVYSPEFKRG